MQDPHCWILILAPQSKVPEEDALEGVLPQAPEAVAKAMECCADLRRDGLSFTGEGLDRIDLASDGVKYVFVNGSPSRSILAAATLAESLVRAIGPITVADEDFILIVEINPGMTSDVILSRLDIGWSAMSGNPRQWA